MSADVDWMKAPKGARWWATDADGLAHWYMAPTVVAFTKFWFADELPAPTFDYEGDWKDSLTERRT